MPASHPASAALATASAPSFSAALQAFSPFKLSLQPSRPSLAVVVALLAIAVQLVVMVQLAQHQVQRGVQLRQAIAADRENPTALFHAKVPLHTAANGAQQGGDGGSVVVQASR